MTFMSLQSVFRLQGVLIVALLLCGLVPAVQAMHSVNLQLSWSHAFQFAGYYAAKEQGYYREAGLDVDIQEAQPGSDPLNNVLDGKAQYGVGNSSLLLARKTGQPVVALAVIFQHSALVLIARQTRAARGVHDIIDKRVMLEPQSDELLAYLKQAGIPLERITRIEPSFNLQDLIDGKVDVISAYDTKESYDLNRAGFAYHSYTPRSVGIDFYGDNLFTTEQELKSNPARVAAFREASLRGWQYAIANPEEIADLIMAKYSRKHSREFYLHEAKRMAPLMQTDLIEIGYMNPDRWRHIVDIYAGLGLLPDDFPLTGFLYQPNPKLELTWLYLVVALLAIVSAITLYILRINRRLVQALADSEQAQKALSLSEEQHRLLADNASDVIWVMDLQGRFTYVSPSVEKLRGYFVDEVMQQSLDQILTPASAAIAKKYVDRAVAAIHARQPVPDFLGELEELRKDGSTVWAEVSISGMCNAAGEFISLLGVARDISERKQTEERLRQMAQHDLLTGLPNRALYSDRLQQALADGRRHGQRLALMFLDLDKFKSINDTQGHAVGDLVLREAALRMQDCVRESDTVARIGGDEFVVLLRSVDSAQNALQVAEKLRLALAQPIHLAGQTLAISASIGIALYPEHGSNEIELSKIADVAMYQAKNNGRDNVQMAPLL